MADARDAPQRDVLAEVLADRGDLGGDAVGGQRDGLGGDAEKREEYAPEETDQALVEVSDLDDHLDVLGRDAEPVGDDLRRHGAVPLALRRRRDAHRDAAVRADA